MANETEALHSLDSGNQLEDVLAMPDHMRDALWRLESARLEAADAAGVLVCGMGGSAIGADLAVAALGDRCTRPVLTVRDYELPSWTTPEWTVLCSSYSGDTEETLACMAAAEAVGARRVVASTGGRLTEEARRSGVPVIGLPGVLQPRAAVAYMVIVAAEVAALAGAAPKIHTEIDGAAAHLERSRDALLEQAESIADRIGAATPLVYGAGLTTPVARRWKTQVNENAKSPAFFAELPEADHNEIEGWAGEPRGGFAAIFVRDPDQHPRVRRRFELTAEAVAAAGAEAISIEAEGDTRTARLFWAVMLGDLTSLMLAARRGLDPTPVDAIESFKEALGRP
jgi:glucose/mannose-6-phosphate isomerase